MGLSCPLMKIEPNDGKFPIFMKLKPLWRISYDPLNDS